MNNPNLEEWLGLDIPNYCFFDDQQLQQFAYGDRAYIVFPSQGQVQQETYMTDTQPSTNLGYQGQPMFNDYIDDFNGANSYVYQQATRFSTLPGPESTVYDTVSPECFDQLHARSDPPDLPGMQRQTPRFEGDLYTARFIKGEGVERAGWCGFCCSWHKLKDSAFWYHMHYSHGVSCATGRQLVGPQNVQWRNSSWHALCGRCQAWLTLGKGDRAAKTAYYRHAYQCHIRDNPDIERASGVKKSRSPRRPGRYGRSTCVNRSHQS